LKATSLLVLSASSAIVNHENQLRVFPYQVFERKN